MSRLPVKSSRYRLFPASLGFALGELRKPGVGLCAIFATLVFAITVLTLTVSLTHSVRDAMRQSAQQTIGGDISLRLFHRAPSPEEMTFLGTFGVFSLTAEQRVMIPPKIDAAPILSELKAIDRTYPLYGAISLSSVASIHDALSIQNGIAGAVVGSEFLEKTGLSVGNMIRLGDQNFQIRDVITSEPERKFRLFALGPRVIVSLDAYRNSNLLSPGKQIYWYARLKTPENNPTQNHHIIAQIEDRFPDSGWRIVDAIDGIPGIERIGDFASAFVGLIGIAVFAITMTAIHNALRADLSARQERFAVLRSTGVRPRQLASAICWLIALVTLAAIAVSSSIVLLANLVVLPLLSHHFGFAVTQTYDDAPVILGFVMSFVALVAISPIRAACQTTPALLFRHQSVRQATNNPKRANLGKVLRSPHRLLFYGLCILLFGLASALIDLGWFSAILISILILCLVVFAGFGTLLRRISGVFGNHHRLPPSIRLALRNIARPNAPTVTMAASFGLACTCLFAVILFGALAGHHLKSVLPVQTPDLVFFDVPPDQQADFHTRVSAIPAVKSVTQMPFLHGRVTHINGQSIKLGDVPRRYHWFIRGDRGISWADRPNADMQSNRVVAGDWWPENSHNAQLASLDADVAKALGIGLGDRLTVNIRGDGYEVRIANVRTIDWTRLGLDFPLVLSPMKPVFAHGVISTVRLQHQDIQTAQSNLIAVARSLETAFPNIPSIRVPDILARLTNLFDAAVQGLVSLTVLATVGALLVIISGLIALRQSQANDLSMLRALGIRPSQIAKTGALEAGIILGASGMLGLCAGALIAIGAGQTIGSIASSTIIAVVGPISIIAVIGIMTIGLGGGWMLQAFTLRSQPGWRG
ncbi:MAG: hypothetical protein KTR23_16525 [Rhodospirillales bacterium]|nr:hypothetical protein [Rhodospirillales bacterium]